MLGSTASGKRWFSEYRRRQGAASRLGPQLCGIAYWQRERPRHKLQTASVGPGQRQNRAHSFAIAAYTVRRGQLEHTGWRYAGELMRKLGTEKAG
jgi:hypothetical protein